jgi:hypothetical protein
VKSSKLIDPLFAMLHQAIVSASLETLEAFCIGSFNLIIGKVFTVPLEGTTGKLGPIISYDSIWDPKPVDDRLDELDY